MVSSGLAIGHTDHTGPRPGDERRPATGAQHPTDHGSRWGPVGSGDVVEHASARLLAAGVDRRERLQALRLLGLLLDHTDADGRVRLPVAALAAEFELDLAAAERGLDHLYDTELVDHDGRHIVVGGGARPRVVNGLRLEAFLTNVAAVLDPGNETGDGSAPVPVPVTTDADTRSVDVREPRPAVSLSAIRPALTVLAAAAIAIAFALAPALRQPSSVTETLAGGTRADRTPAAPPRADHQDPATDVTPAPTAGPSPSTSPGATAPAPRLPDGSGAPRSTTSLLVPCPPVEPRLLVVAVSSRLNGGITSLAQRVGVQEGASVWEVVVEGGADNQAAADALIEHFEVVVVVDGVEHRVAGPTVRAAAGETTAWVVTIPAGSTPPEVEEATVALTRWSWDDPTLAGCG